MYEHITHHTKDILEKFEEKIDQKTNLIDKKIFKFQEDLKEFKKTKTSTNALNKIKTNIEDQKQLKKHMQKDGVLDLLYNYQEKQIKSKYILSEKVVSSLDKFISKGLNQTVYDSLKNINQLFDRHEKNKRKSIEKIKKSNKKYPKNILEALVGIDALNNQKKLLEDTLSIISSVKISAKDNIKPSNYFPLKTTRNKLAKKCVTTSRRELSGTLDYLDEDDYGDGLEMMAMFIDDAFNHYDLGVQILGGDPRKIDDAASMDTASRDGIDEEVWNFINTKIFDKDIFGPKALKEHRQKIQEQEARKVKKSMKKAIGGPSNKKIASVKKI